MHIYQSIYIYMCMHTHVYIFNLPFFQLIETFQMRLLDLPPPDTNMDCRSRGVFEVRIGDTSTTFDMLDRSTISDVFMLAEQILSFCQFDFLVVSIRDTIGKGV